MCDQAWFPRLFGGLIVPADPRPQALAFVPTGIVPDDDQDPFTFLPGDSQQRDDQQPRLFTIRLTETERQINLGCVLPYRAKTRQRFFGFVTLWFAHD